MLGGGVMMHVVSATMGESVVGLPPLEEALALAYLALAASAVGFLIYFRLLGRIGPIEINLVSYVAPVAAAIVGFLWLGEVIDANTVGGFVVIFVGFVLIKRRAIRGEIRRYRTRS